MSDIMSAELRQELRMFLNGQENAANRAYLKKQNDIIPDQKTAFDIDSTMQVISSDCYFGGGKYYSAFSENTLPDWIKKALADGTLTFGEHAPNGRSDFTVNSPIGKAHLSFGDYLIRQRDGSLFGGRIVSASK